MTSQFPDIVILVGSGRSGTTYLTKVLRKSMGIGFCGEPKFVIPLFRRLHRYGDLKIPENLRNVAAAIHQSHPFEALHRRYGIPSRPEEILEKTLEPTYTGLLYAAFQVLAEKRGNFPRLGYKDPVDVENITVLAELFPTGRFVHIIRDGRDVALSVLKRPWGATNLYCAARDWCQGVAAGRRSGASLSDRYMELRYEDLMANTEREAVRLVSFIEGGRNPEKEQDLIALINGTKRADRSQAWRAKMSLQERLVCEAAAGDMLRAFGYPTESENAVTISPLAVGYYRGTDVVFRAKNRILRAMKPGIVVEGRPAARAPRGA